MSLMPEFIFQTAIVRGIQAFRNDHRFIDQLFRNLDQEAQDEMRKFITDNAIDLCINYPRAGVKVPAIVILLKAETEFSGFLSDSMGVDTIPDSLSYDGGIEDEVLGGTASISTLSGQGQLEFGPYLATSGTLNTLKVTGVSWPLDQFRGRDLVLNVVAGTGVGQRRGITANNHNTLMVAPNWSTVPDNTTVFEIRRPAFEVVGEPSSVYNRRSTGFVERKGAIYSVSYQVQIIAENPEITIYLTTLVKAILTLSRIFLERQGVMNLKMGASDFMPRTEYQPDLTYMRSINLDFQYHFDVFEELGDLATSLRLVLENETPSVVISDQLITPIGKPEPSVSGP